MAAYPDAGNRPTYSPQGGERRYLAHPDEAAGLTYLLDLNVLSRLELEAVSALKSLPRRGLETGGVLLGMLDDRGTSRTLRVDDFLPIASEHRYGPDFHLSDADIAELEAMHGRPIVGTYRSHTRPEHWPVPDDQDLVTHVVGHPRLHIVIQPTQRGTGTAVLFRSNAAGLQEIASVPMKASLIESAGLLVVAEPVPDSQPRSVERVSTETIPAPTRSPSRPLAYVALVALLAFLAWAYLPNRPNPTISQAPSPESSRSRSEPVTVLGHQEEMAKAEDSRPPALGPSVAQPTAPPSPSAATRLPVSPREPVTKRGSSLRGEAPPSTLAPIPEPPPETDDFEANDPHPQSFLEPRRTKLEAVPEPLIKRVWDRVPGVRRLQRNYRGGDGFQPPTAGRQISPSFPVSLRSSLKAASPLVIRLNLDEAGRVKKAKVLSKRVDPRVRDFALDAVKRWRFRPARLEGRAISSRVNVVFQF